MELITVLLSAYNEPISMIQKSVESVINQTHTNLEIILINDNPYNRELDETLQRYRDSDTRIQYRKHDENKGLVYSLNEGIKIASGEYVARMDADDISYPDRLEKQLAFMQTGDYDMVGTSVVKINEKGEEIGELKVPADFESIIKYQKYGSCVLHPTWLVKKAVYDALHGYRAIYACEDYDFILRAIAQGYKIGNLSEAKLYYRIRTSGISMSANVKQKLTMYFLAEGAVQGRTVPLEEINHYLESEVYKKDFSNLQRYEDTKCAMLKSRSCVVKIRCLLRMLRNRFFYKNIVEHSKMHERQRRARST